MVNSNSSTVKEMGLKIGCSNLGRAATVYISVRPSARLPVTDTLSPASGVDAGAPKGLAARMAGVIFSPGDTFRAIVAQPRVLGVLAVTTIVMAAAVFAFLSTEVGQ